MDRRLGMILGYPPDAVQFFLDHDGNGPSHTNSSPRASFHPDERADAGFVVYRHHDSIEGYERPIQTERQIRFRLENLTEK